MFNIANYSSNIQTILGPHEAGQRLMPLAPTAPLRGPGLTLLCSAAAPQLFNDAKLASQEFAQCVRSALFLYFSDLEESHKISQGIYSSTGSFLHGIMHRQEPDFSNAKYWFRRVPTHEVFPELRQTALNHLQGAAAQAGKRLHAEIDSRSQWDPQWFVDECEAVHSDKDAETEECLMEIQRIEWQVTFDYCYGRALKKA